MKNYRGADSLCTPYWDERPEGHSQGKDYKIGYGNGRTRIDSYGTVDESKKWSKKQSRESGLIDKGSL